MEYEDGSSDAPKIANHLADLLEWEFRVELWKMFMCYPSSLGYIYFINEETEAQQS